MAAVTICSDFGAPKNSLPIYFPWSDGTRCPMILVFWMLSFKPTFPLSSFTFIKRLFSSSSLSAIRVVSSAYLRLLIFLPANLIPACASSSPVFLMMYSAYKLNKQGDNIQPWRIPSPCHCKNISIPPSLCLWEGCCSICSSVLPCKWEAFEWWGCYSHTSLFCLKFDSFFT